MQNERYYWQVCFDDGDVWACIGTHETRAEAEAEVVVLHASSFWPDAFLVRQTLTRMDQVSTPPPLTAV